MSCIYKGTNKYQKKVKDIMQSLYPNACVPSPSSPSSLSAAWTKLNDEIGQPSVVALSMVEALAKLSFKSAHEHEQFQELYDAWRR